MRNTTNSNFPLFDSLALGSFRIDALGLVTLLGADEVVRTIGSLTRNTITDYLPIFGAYKVAANQFASPEAGFALYNITDGIWVTELNGWTTRWLASNLKYRYTAIKVSINRTSRGYPLRDLVALVIGCICNLGLVALAALQADWYGVANGCAIFISTGVRNFLLYSERRFLDGLVEDNFVKRKQLKGVVKAITQILAPRAEESIMESSKDQAIVKLLIVLPDGKLAISYTHRGLIGLFLTPLETVSQHWWNRLVRALGWVAFAVHVVAIGMSTLETQIATVPLMAAATLLTIFRIGVQNEHEVGKWINIRQTELGRKRRLQTGRFGRQDVYARLQPTGGRKAVILSTQQDHLPPLDRVSSQTSWVLGGEIKYMHNWALFPQEDASAGWFDDFIAKRDSWNIRDDKDFELEMDALNQQPKYRDED